MGIDDVIIDAQNQHVRKNKDMIEARLLEILACPVCKGPLIHDTEKQELCCKFDRLAFPVRDDIPVMLEAEARELSEDELAALS